MAGLSLRKAAALATVGLASLASTACDQAKIMATAEDYVAGLGMAHPGMVWNLSDNFTYIENNKTTDFETGVMSQGMDLDYNRTIVDMVECATYTEVVAALTNHSSTKYVIGAQIRHALDADNNVYVIDSVVTTNGSWFFNGTSTLQHIKAENWSVLEPSRRSSRTELKRVADAYLDMWTNKSAIAAIPFGDGCKRVEGGNFYDCPVGIPTNNSQLPNSHRRYVIDEAFGSVEVISVWEHLNDTIDSHEFRLESGKLHFVHAMAWTDNRKCGQEKEGWRCR